MIDLTIHASGHDAGAGGEFLDVRGLTLCADGRMVVADERAGEIRVFSPTGELDYVVAASAPDSPPAQPCCAAFGDDGRLWVFDRTDTTYRAYRLGLKDARLEKVVRVDAPASGLQRRVMWDEKGRLVHLADAFEEHGQRFLVVRTLVDSMGRVALVDTLMPQSVDKGATVTLTSVDEGGVTVVSQPFGPSALRAFGQNGERVEAITSRYDVTWLNRGGEVLHSVRRLVTAPAVSRRESRSAVARLERLVASLHLPASAIPFGIPERKAPLRGVGFDLDGRLWVERSVADGDPSMADVYDRSGKWLTLVEWPADVRLGYWAIHGDTALGWASAGVGAERVVRMHFVPIN